LVLVLTKKAWSWSWSWSWSWKISEVLVLVLKQKSWSWSYKNSLIHISASGVKTEQVLFIQPQNPDGATTLAVDVDSQKIGCDFVTYISLMWTWLQPKLYKVQRPYGWELTRSLLTL